MHGHYFEVRPVSYLYPVGSGMCLLGLAEGSDYWLFGDVFLREYYSIWDDQGGTLGLAPHIHTTATVVQGTKPTKELLLNTDSMDLV